MERDTHIQWHKAAGFALDIIGYVCVRDVRVIRLSGYRSREVENFEVYPHGTFECSMCQVVKRMSCTDPVRIRGSNLVCVNCHPGFGTPTTSIKSMWYYENVLNTLPQWLRRGTPYVTVDDFTFTDLMARVHAVNCPTMDKELIYIVKAKAAKVIQMHARIFLARKAATRRNLRIVLPVMIKRGELPRDVLVRVKAMCLGCHR